MEVESVPPSDEEIRIAVFDWLKGVDANTVTLKDLKNQLESEHNWNLNDKKALLKQYLHDFFDQSQPAPENDEENDEGEVEDSEGNQEQEEESPIPKKRKQGGGFQAPVQLSTKLSQFLDDEIVLPRPEVTKRVWAYIKEHNLQNPKNKREILCDEKLEDLLGRKKIDMFRMTKVLSENMKSVAELQSGIGNDSNGEDEEEDEEPMPKKKRATKLEKQLTAREAARETSRKAAAKLSEKESKKKKEEKKASKEKSSKKRQTGITRPVELSDALTEFLGYHVIPRTQVTKLMWKYIRENNRQDPKDKRRILCDAKMEELFKKKSFTMFQMTTYLSEMMSSTDLPSEYIPNEPEDDSEQVEE